MGAAKKLKVLGPIQKKRLDVVLDWLGEEWRSKYARRNKIEESAYVGLPTHTKRALRERAAEATRRAGRRVSMSEVARRLLAAGGIK